MDGRQHAWLPNSLQGDAPPRRKLQLPGAGSAPSTEMRHERRRTAAHLLAIDPEGATDLGHLRTRFVRRQRTKEAAAILRGGSTTNSAASITESLQRSDSFGSATGFGSYRGAGGSFANFNGSFLSNVGLGNMRDNGSTRSDWNDQWSRAGSWMTRGGSFMSFADDPDLQLDGLQSDSGSDSIVGAVEAAKQELLQHRASFHYDELAQVLQEQRSCSTNAVSISAFGIAEAMREYSEENRHTTGPSVDSKELLEHPQRMPNLLRASSTCVVGLPDFKRGDREGEGVSDEEEERFDGWRNGAFYDPRLRRTAYRHRLPMSVWARWLSTHAYFRGYIIFLVVLSSIVLAVQVEVPPEEWQTHLMIDRLDQFILLSFMVEILLKWIDSFRSFWHDGWNTFDFVITLMSLLPELLSLFNSSGTLDSGLPKLVRQLRVLRALRSFKMIAKFGTLKVIIATILETFSSIGNIMLLLVIVMYIYGVVACHLFEHYSLSAEHGGSSFPEKFASLDQSFVSLFQLLTLDQWHVIYKDLMAASGLPDVVVTMFIVSWVWLGAFVFRNIFVGVIVHGFQQARATNKGSSDSQSTPDKPMGGATDRGAAQKKHSGSGNSEEEGNAVSERRGGRTRKLALDSSDPTGALAMTRTWLAERDEWISSKDHSRLDKTADKGPACLFGGRLRTVEAAREKHRQLMQTRSFSFHPRRRRSDGLHSDFTLKMELSAQSRRAKSKPHASKRCNHLLFNHRRYLIPVDCCAKTRWLICGRCACRATKTSCTSTGAENHVNDTQAKQDPELPDIGEDAEHQDDRAAQSRPNECSVRTVHASDPAEDGWCVKPRGCIHSSFKFASVMAVCLSGMARLCGHVRPFKNTLSCLLHYKIICASMKSFR
eukprot:COSAG02_NODE_928_length_15853_cov_9.053574_10_plen_882_part_00